MTALLPTPRGPGLRSCRRNLAGSAPHLELRTVLAFAALCAVFPDPVGHSGSLAQIVGFRLLDWGLHIAMASRLLSGSADDPLPDSELQPFLSHLCAFLHVAPILSGPRCYPSAKVSFSVLVSGTPFLCYVLIRGTSHLAPVLFPFPCLVSSLRRSLRVSVGFSDFPNWRSAKFRCPCCTLLPFHMFPFPGAGPTAPSPETGLRRLFVRFRVCHRLRTFRLSATGNKRWSALAQASMQLALVSFRETH